MRAALTALPDGVYEGEDFLDDGGPDGGPARIHVRITIDGDEAEFDLSGCCDRVANFCNTTPFIARSAIIYAARLLSGRDMQQNAGALRPLTIITRPGSIVEPGWNAAGRRRQSRDQHAHRRRRHPRDGARRAGPSRRRRADHVRAAGLCRTVRGGLAPALRGAWRRRGRAARTDRAARRRGCT